MRCIYCGSPTKVIDKRNTADHVIRRRRACIKCGKRFTTYENVSIPEAYVIKKDGRREPFNKEKIIAGLIKACQKRPISIETINAIASEIESKIVAEHREVKTRYIGELIMKKLKKLDKVAYIRFASVYKEFQDLDSFENEIKKLKK